MMEKQEELLRLSKHELLKVATNLDVKYRTRMGKPELVDSIIDLLAVKGKDADPKLEKLISDQLISAKKEIQDLSLTKEEIESSKFQSLPLDNEKIKAELKKEDLLEPELAQAKVQQPAYQLSKVLLDDSTHLNPAYGDNEITMMVIDPTHVYSYWEVTDDKKNEALSSAGSTNMSYESVVRVYDVTDVSFNGENAWTMREFNVGFSVNWFLQVEANRSYCAEIGLKLGDSRFIVIARSNIIITPREGVSDYYDEEWMMIDFNKKTDIVNEMFRLSGGHLIKRYQLNSGFITERVLNEVNISVPSQSLSSESLSSQMQGYKEFSDEFWMWVDTELIVYGQIKPDASLLTINGEKIKHDKDGRFRLQMALPNGKYPFTVKGVSKNGNMSKQITPVVTRSLEKTVSKVQNSQEIVR